MLCPLQNLIPHLPVWGPRQTPKSGAAVLSFSHWLFFLLIYFRQLAESQLLLLLYFAQLKPLNLSLPSNAISPSSDQSEQEAGDPLTDRHFVLAPKHIYLLSYSNTLVLVSGLLPCPHVKIPFDLSNRVSAWLPHLILVLMRIFPAHPAYNEQEQMCCLRQHKEGDCILKQPQYLSKQKTG